MHFAITLVVVTFLNNYYFFKYVFEFQNKLIPLLCGGKHEARIINA